MGLIRRAAIATVTVTVYASPMAAGSPGRRVSTAVWAAAAVTAPGPKRAEPLLYRQIVNRMLPWERGSITAVVRASLAFVVSVCLADVEYSIACRERGVMEAAQRIEQIFAENYTTRRSTGSLKVVFWAEVDSREQLRFLRDAEIRAIEAAGARLQSEHPSQYQQLETWHDAARQEAFSGGNWLHDWSTRTHQYQAGPARLQIAHING
jgi:hypothetical protein